MKNVDSNTDNPYAAPECCPAPSRLSSTQIHRREKLREWASRIVWASGGFFLAMNADQEMVQNKTGIDSSIVIPRVMIWLGGFTLLLIWQAIGKVKDEQRKM